LIFVLFCQVHRLTAALAFFLRLSPQYESQIKPLLEVLQARKLLQGKLVKGSGWNVDGGIGKKEIRKLVEEVAMKLCP
jgi:desumoylating isopeptidase 1